MSTRLEITRPETVQLFRSQINDIAPLPWREGRLGEDGGYIYDANEKPVAGILLEATGRQFVTAAWIVVAVNTCGGYRFDAAENKWTPVILK